MTVATHSKLVLIHSRIRGANFVLLVHLTNSSSCKTLRRRLSTTQKRLDLAISLRRFDDAVFKHLDDFRVLKLTDLRSKTIFSRVHWWCVKIYKLGTVYFCYYWGKMSIPHRPKLWWHARETFIECSIFVSRVASTKPILFELVVFFVASGSAVCHPFGTGTVALMHRRCKVERVVIV